MHNNYHLFFAAIQSHWRNLPCFVYMPSHPLLWFGATKTQIRATIMRIVFDPRTSSLVLRECGNNYRTTGGQKLSARRMFLTITFLPYGLRQILLHILNEPDEYFQLIYGCDLKAIYISSDTRLNLKRVRH